jgi:hypothetical protein
MLGTADDEGEISISPRGGHAGFVRVTSETTLQFDDLVGNNLMESHRNILVNDRVSLLFIISGREETLRARGRARLLHLSGGSHNTGISVEIVVDHWYYHCGRSFRLSETWNSDEIIANQSIAFSKRPSLKGI